MSIEAKKRWDTVNNEEPIVEIVKRCPKCSPTLAQTFGIKAGEEVVIYRYSNRKLYFKGYRVIFKDIQDFLKAGCRVRVMSKNTTTPDTDVTKEVIQRVFLDSASFSVEEMIEHLIQSA